MAGEPVVTAPPRARPSRPAQLPLVLAGAAAVLAIALHLAVEPWLGARGAAPQAVAFLGRLHPLAVHGPIGILVLVVVLEGLALAPRLRAAIDAVLGTILALAVASALSAFALGLMLAQEGGHPAGLLRWHRLLAVGIVVGAAASLAAWTLHARSGAPRAAYRIALGATVAVMAVGAHFGGSMTHGERYLVQHAPAFARRWLEGDAPRPSEPTPAAAEVPSEARVFAHVVLPILQAKCAGCHGADKVKAGLRMDSLEGLSRGGDGGPAIAPGRPRESLMVVRIRKDPSDDEHMPPADEPQVTADELELLELWIKRGARDDLMVRELLVPEGARRLLSAAGSAASDAPAPAAPAAQDQATTPVGPTPPADPAPPRAAPPPGGAAVAEASPRAVEAAPPAPPVVTAAAGGLVYRDRVAPLLAARCERCHGPEKRRGKLRTDSIAALLAGGSEGPAIVPFQAGRGTLLARVALPLDDGEHMPPEGEPQLGAQDIALVRVWIAGGATTSMTLAALPSAVASAPAVTAPPGASAAEAGAPSPSPATADAPGASPPDAPASDERATDRGASDDPAARAAASAAAKDEKNAATKAERHRPPVPRPAPPGAGCAGCSSARGGGQRAAGAGALLLALLLARRRTPAQRAR